MISFGTRRRSWGSGSECRYARSVAAFLKFDSLKNHGADNEVNAMFDMGEETMKLPLAEKMKYEQGDGGSNFGCASLHTLASA